MTNIPLTASQIKAFDEINIDKKTVSDTLDVALQFHANKVNELHKAERALWEEIIKAHGLDNNTDWKTAKVEGSVVVTEANPK